MDRIKSAFEKAMERAEQFDEPGEEQRLEWKLLPQGQRLAGSFIKGQGSPFSTIEKAPPEHRSYLVKGMAEILVSNLQLPKTEGSQQTNTRVIEGLERLLADKPPIKELLQRVRYVSDQYRQFGLPQREQAYQQLKAQMEQQVTEAMSRQMGPTAGPLRVNVETIPEFQQQWLAVSAQMDQQYEQHLEEYRKQLLELV
jgi:hypothetical protein